VPVSPLPCPISSSGLNPRGSSVSLKSNIKLLSCPTLNRSICQEGPLRALAEISVRLPPPLPPKQPTFGRWHIWLRARPIGHHSRRWRTKRLKRRESHACVALWRMLGKENLISCTRPRNDQPVLRSFAPTSSRPNVLSSRLSLQVQVLEHNL
jgi:hypothetical protein